MKRILSTYHIKEFIKITNTLLKKRIFFFPIIHSTRSFLNYFPFCYRPGYCLKQELDKEYIYTVWIFSNKEIPF